MPLGVGKGAVLATSFGEPASGSLSYAEEVLADSPDLFWKFDESSGSTAADATANGNDGTYGSGVTLGEAGAFPDSTAAILGDGTANAIVTSSYTPPSGTAARSFEFWFGENGPSGDQVILSYGNATSSGTGEKYTIRIDAEDLRVEVDGGYFLISGLPMDDGRRHHCVVVFPSGATNVNEHIFYIDGADASVNGTASSSQVMNTGTTNTLQVGEGIVGALNFDGFLDEMAVYPSALSAARVLAHYEAAIPDPGYTTEVLADSPQNFWRLNEASGTTATDEQGNQDGSHVGGVTLQAPSIMPGESILSTLYDGTGGTYTDITGAEAFVNSSSTGSIEVWATQNSNSTLQSYVEFGDASDGDEGVFLRHDSTQVKARWRTGGVNYTAFATINDGEVHHIVMTWDASTVYLYVDGSLIDSVARGADTTTLDRAAIAGYAQGSGAIGSAGDSFDGRISNVAIYPTTLSDARVLAHYTSGVGA